MKSFDFLQQSLLSWYRLWEGGPLTCCVLVFLSSLILITTSMVQWWMPRIWHWGFGKQDQGPGKRVLWWTSNASRVFVFGGKNVTFMVILIQVTPYHFSSWKNDNACVRTPDDIDTLWAYYYHAAWVIFWDINWWVCFSCSTVPFFFFPV